MPEISDWFLESLARSLSHRSHNKAKPLLAEYDAEAEELEVPQPIKVYPLRVGLVEESVSVTP